MARDRTIVFIDNSNIFQEAKKKGWRVDVGKFYQHLQNDGEVWQVHFFASVIDPPRTEQTGFYRYVKQELHFEVHLYQLRKKTARCFKCQGTWQTWTEKGVDVGLATKMLTLANDRAFDTAILVGADRDYLETVQAVKQKGLRVEMFAWKGSISKEMADESSMPVVYFDDIREAIEQLAPDEEMDELLTGSVEFRESKPRKGEPAAS